MRAALVVLVGTAACSIPDGEYFGKVPEPDPTHFRWCNSAEPEYLDPGLANSTADVRVIHELFDGLTTYDPNASPRPSIAARWDISPDQKRFTFHLRRDARWSNGRPITAHDFVYSYARVLHPLTASQNAENLWRIRNGRPYNAGVARLVLRDAPPFRAGDVVTVDDAAPPSNLRRPRAATPLRAAPDETAAVWATAPPGAELTIVELDRARGWAYLHLAGGDGVFGWAPTGGLDSPYDGHLYAAVAVGDPAR
jgi:oligopeptide transport system substrate-binding protein